MTRLTFVGKPECHLCDDAHAVVDEVLAEFPGVEVIERSILDEPELFEAYADEISIEIEGLGSTTFDREDLQKGLEPDECYYVQNAHAVKGRQEFDFSVDPPPDLAIQIDISPPDVARQPIYAALGVPEFWKYDGNEVHFLKRTKEGQYVAADRSLAFPELPASELNRLLQVALADGQTAAVRALRGWSRRQLP